MRFVIYSLIPIFLLVSVGEIAIRILDLDKPFLHTRPLLEEVFGAFQQDPDLFWSVRPNVRLEVKSSRNPKKVKIETNSIGLRCPEIKKKAFNEYRILSLGESTTFGSYVSNNQTYSSHLESLLNVYAKKHKYRVINTGVPAYTSFQSLMYLKLRGLDLKPDMVLFYHEINDYLPSSLRSSTNTEIGIAKTDMELYESMKGSLSRKLLAWSAIIRFFSYRLASYQISKMKSVREEFSAEKIGLEKLGAIPSIYRFSNGKVKNVNLNHDTLPRRVSTRELQEILTELNDLCELHGITLVIIHPSYKRSRKHHCVLTEYCFKNKISMFEAQDVLHRSNVPLSSVYCDLAHPTPYGHRLLAEGLFGFLMEEELVPLNKQSFKADNEK